jgi:PAS domain S-box-containing protein
LNRREYSRLLIQLLLLPLPALSILAVGLGYSLQRLEKSAAWVDHSDRVAAQANRLLKLIVDEETGIRGYFLTRDPSFLEPYHRAENTLPQEFDAALSMVRDNPGQIARLQQLRQSYAEWEAATREELVAPATAHVDMHGRKRTMDAIRSQAGSFLRAEETLRLQRTARATIIGSSTRSLLMALIVLIGVGIAWITQRCFSRLSKLFEEQLREAEAQRIRTAEGEQWLNTTLRSIGDGVIACDPEGRIVLMNPVAEQLTGWRELDAKGLLLGKVFQIVTENTRVIVEDPVEKVRRTGRIVSLANHTILIRKDASECGVDDSASPIRDAEGRLIGIVLVFRDCTERRSSETALMRAEKLAAAGKLAASIAHEVNNPLEGLTNMLYLAGESTDLAEIQPWLAQAQSEVNRLSHITRQTLGFYHESTQPVAYRPADVMEEVLAFYVPEAMSRNVQLQSRIRTQQETFGIPGELRQVLSNLIANSLDAMLQGGVVRLVVRQVTDLKDAAKTGLRITVADTGSGIAPEILDHVFEPFFTTKVDTGTGLGLWVSKELIEKQGGRLRVRSNVSGGLTGTAFSIYIPVRSAEAETNSGLQDALEEAQV